MTARRLLRDDSAITAVIGAIVVLAVAATAILYLNAFHVPRQGASLETAGAEETRGALLHLASALSTVEDAPILEDVPLRAKPAAPPALAGVVLSPARAEGALALNLSSSRMGVSLVLDAPPGGVPADDPTRVDLGDGRMRHHLLGNATTSYPVGALDAGVGGVYTARTQYVLEAGALLSRSPGASLSLAPPALDVARVGDATSVAWRIPLLGGAVAQTQGGSTAQLLLRPGPVSSIGAAHAYEVQVRVETEHVAAWTAALREAVGAHGFVNATLSGPADNGTVVATILPPPGAPAGAKLVEARLLAVRFETDVAQGFG